MGKAWPALALVAGLTAAAPAAAEEPIETGVRAWIAAIDATQAWEATVDSVTADAPDHAVIRHLTIRSVAPGISVDIPVATISGFVPSTDGSLHAANIAFPSATIGAGPYTAVIYETTLNGVVLPADGFTWIGGEPNLALARALPMLANLRVDSARALRAVLVEEFRNVRSNVSYGDVTIGGWHDGRIASASAVSLRSQSPSDDPLVTMTAARAETRDIDLRALGALFDPDAAETAWRSVVGHAEESDITIVIGRLSAHIGKAAIDDFRVRRSNAGAPPADDPLAIHATMGALGRYGFGGLSLTDIDFGLSGSQKASLGSIALKAVDVEHIGSFAVDGFEGKADANSLSIDHFGFEGLELPSPDAISTAALAFLKGGDPDLTALLPSLTGLSASGIDVSVQGVPETKLGSLDVALADRVGTIPTSIRASLSGADIDPRLIPAPEVGALLRRFGYERINLDASADVRWRDDGGIAVNSARAALKGIGTLSGRAELTGPRPTDVSGLHTAGDLVDTLKLTRGTLTYEDETLVARLVDEQAKRTNVDPTAFREQFAKGLPLLLTFLGNPDLQKQLASTLQAMVRSAGSITLSAEPPSPVPLSDIAAAATTAPFALLGTLAVKVGPVSANENNPPASDAQP